jgi:hypothetical protein
VPEQRRPESDGSVDQGLTQPDNTMPDQAVPDNAVPDQAATVSAPRGVAVDETTLLPKVSVPTAIGRAGKPAAAPAHDREAVSQPGGRSAAFDIVRISPPSVVRLVLVIGVPLFALWMTGIVAGYLVLAGTGTWDRLNGTLRECLRVRLQLVLRAGRRCRADAGRTAVAGPCCPADATCTSLTGQRDRPVRLEREVSRSRRG